MKILPDDKVIVKLVKVINSCRSPIHIQATSKMLAHHERRYGPDYTLRRYLLESQFDVIHHYSKLQSS